MTDTTDRTDKTEKTDFKKTLDSYQAKRGVFRVVDVPPLQYLMIDGHGDPNTSPAFAEAIAALYPIAYKVKFASKKQLGRDYVVMPLEGLWWSDTPANFTSARDKSTWSWTLMIMQPEWITAELVADAIAAVTDAPAAVSRVRFETLAEGRCVQTLHVGSFDDEAATLAELHDRFIPEHGLTMTGHHHEIYFSDFRTVAPEKLRTILRQPVAPA
ncbi:GyrI-like domain-containing protein [Salinibacterium soli]|uniref:GyrI-like domain-containing protein n=1 Tax=Antiquaquibacter soli TaxID=3064523 RepID=A0ABT9BRY1_9MICO|nr:GyrI-like domain-containing protein [Protaetiibacter sp. WY-16]MDO7883192.1 GyrI-like domain-containing protein [Protaetiibacter sp. WY-16]